MPHELVEVRNQRDAVGIDLWNNITRTRSFMKGFYGPDSTEYKLAGGTRKSERKKPRRKAPFVSRVDGSGPDQTA